MLRDVFVIAQPPLLSEDRSVQIRLGLELSAGTDVAAKAAALLSRGAATDRSHGRKAVGQVSFRTEPRERAARNLSPLRGSSSNWPEIHGLAPVAVICRRSAARIGCASRDILDSTASERRAKLATP